MNFLGSEERSSLGGEGRVWKRTAEVFNYRTRKVEILERNR